MFAEVMVPESLSLRRVRVIVFLGILLGAIWAMGAERRAQAQEEDPVALQKITDLNKKALEAYEALDFEQARKYLKDAFDACAAASFDKHPIKARTHIHMGAVLFGGFKQRDLAVKQFKKALEIEPDIKLTKSVATPEVQAAFEEAKASMASAGDAAGAAPPPPEAPPPEAEPAQAEPAGTPSASKGILHTPVTQGRRGQPLPIAVSLAPELEGVSKVVLAYRADGAASFMARDLTKSGNGYSGEIPADATNGRSLSYYIEAHSADDSVVAAAGSAEASFFVVLGGSTSSRSRKSDEDEDAPKVFLSLSGGFGYGYASGSGEVLTDHKAPGGFAPASAAHLQLEGGYFVTPQIRVSLQARIQFVSGPNGYFDSSMSGQCGRDNYCSPANGAFALLARGAWFFPTTSRVRPYLGVALGGGQIRHVVSFSSPTTCGKTGTSACKDSVASGPIFLGPNGGVLVAITDKAGVVVELASQLGFPKFTFNFDVNGGFALSF